MTDERRYPLVVVVISSYFYVDEHQNSGNILLRRASVTDESDARDDDFGSGNKVRVDDSALPGGRPRSRQVQLPGQTWLWETIAPTKIHAQYCPKGIAIHVGFKSKRAPRRLRYFQEARRLLRLILPSQAESWR